MKGIIKNILNKIYFIPLFLFIVYSFININQDIYAQTPTPTPTPTPVPIDEIPLVEIKQAIAYTNIASSTANDFFVIFEYDLKYDENNLGWCKNIYLVDDNGCELEPPKPQFPFSILSDRIYAEYKDDSGLVHIQNGRIPRIGKGLMGLYAEAPSGTLFGNDSDNSPSSLPGTVCFIYNIDYFPSTFNNPSYFNNCVTVQHNNGGAPALANEISGGSGILYDLEENIGLPLNTLVNSSGLVTPTGALYLEESLQGIQRVALDSNGNPVFELSSTFPLRNNVTVGTNNEFENKIIIDNVNAGTSNALNIIAGEYLGFSGGWFATIIFLILAIIAAGTTLYTTQNSFFAFLALIIMLLPSMFIGGVSIPFLFTSISIFLVFGSWYWIRRSPE